MGFAPGGGQGGVPQDEKQMESTSQIRTAPINCLTCTTFTISLVAVVVAFGALSHPLSHLWFQSQLWFHERWLQPTSGTTIVCLLSNWGSCWALWQVQLGSIGELWLWGAVLYRERTGAGGSIPLLSVIRREDSGSHYVACLWNPWDLTDTPLVGFETFRASPFSLLLLGIISRINYLKVLVSSSNFRGKQLSKLKKWSIASKNWVFSCLLKQGRPSNPENRFLVATAS